MKKSFLLRVAGLLAAAGLLATCGSPDALIDYNIYWPATINGQGISMTLDCFNGITLHSLKNLSNGFEHIAAPTALFEFSLDNGLPHSSSGGIVVDVCEPAASGDGLHILAHVDGEPLVLELLLRADSMEPVIVTSLSIANQSAETHFLKTVVPKIHSFKVQTGDLMGMIPQEIGNAVPLESLPNHSAIGMPLNSRIGLPASMNVMEVASLYSRSSGGGIFFSDVDGNLEKDLAPIQFTLSDHEIAGYWTSPLVPHQTVTLPRFAIGVHEHGDWRTAVDYYLAQHKSAWKFQDTPAWLKEAGAIYNGSGGGGGGAYQFDTGTALSERIDGFLCKRAGARCLVTLLDEAKSLGTNILYLHDYWEGAPGAPFYFNKGDYIPRSDFGGAGDFAQAIADIHARGGRVILYVEPFIVSRHSNIWNSDASKWGLSLPFGLGCGQEISCPYYDENESMLAPFEPWQNYVVTVAERLVKSYGADGIFLDSWGWQMNWPAFNEIQNVHYTSKQWSQGVLKLVDKVRTAIRKIKQDAVVLTESNSGELPFHSDAGSSGDFSFSWYSQQNLGKLNSSPVRYGMPQALFFTNGSNLAQLNQVFAAGHGLELFYKWATTPSQTAYIRKLVEIRKTYKDALVYGDQSNIETNSPQLSAYHYRGVSSEILVVVNLSERLAQSVSFVANNELMRSSWTRLIGADTRHQSELLLPPGELAIYFRNK